MFSVQCNGGYMYVNIKKFKYNGWNNQLYCFDREAYSFADISLLDSGEDNIYYRRYISLPDIDYDACKDDYIGQMNNKVLYSRYRRNSRGFFDFVECNGLDADWRKFEYEWICKKLVEWCIDNDLQYNEG